MTTLININSVVKESAKAICISLPVSWGNGGLHIKEMWFPKSVIVKMNDRCAEVQDWFIRKTEQANSFNGYMMSFDR